MKNKCIFYMLIILGLLLVTACSDSNTTSEVTPAQEPANTQVPPDDELPPSSYLPEVPRISVHGVKAKIDAGANVLIVDSRSVEDFNEVHIIGAFSKEAPVNPDGYDEIITYCR